MGKLASPRPLGPDDDRDSFDCGKPSLNHWLQRHAWRNQQSGMSRTTVVPVARTNQLAAFVSLSAGQIQRTWLAKTDQRNRPDPIPVILLGQLAVDLNYQGQGLARSLIRHALITALTAAEAIGCFAVITHPLDDTVRAFYGQFGFVDLPFDPARNMAVRMTVLRANMPDV